MSYFFIAIAVSLVLGLLKYNSSKTIDLDSASELRLSKFYWYFGIGCVLIAVISSVTVVVSNEKDVWISVLFILGFFGGLGLIIAMIYQNHRIKIEDDTLTVLSFWKVAKTVKWNEIKSIAFNPVSGYIKFHGPIDTLKIHFHIVGLVDLLELADRQTNGLTDQIQTVRNKLNI
ncbi:hypothetical protein SAMN05421640_0203 [Ekhidna lutea]|uniref:Uncharacterized protein n=1 Tax=Ekhidna lutea TaxID=447679 RepID=A0A239EME2_EKHLU|nr:hypothetical protein [Ekhidna lutea]SNS45183.1 hypothetical protein SAMN05421640_0203 [Ekhidna lutea]